MINIPRAFFQSRTGRQPIYHIAIEEMQDWAYAGDPLVPLKGYPIQEENRVQEARLSASIRQCRSRHRIVWHHLRPVRSIVPSTTVTVLPPIQMSSPSRFTCTRPARPSAVPWLAM